MYRRTLLGVLAVAMWLFCAQNLSAGVACYKYDYAPNLVRAVQKFLKEEGLYHGLPDGKYGPKTKSAVRSFQRKRGIFFFGDMMEESNSGQLEERTLRAMFGENAPAGVKVVRNPHQAPEDIWGQYCQ